MLLAGERVDFDAAHEADLGVGVDSLDQVVGHRLCEIGAADRDRHGAVALREVDRGLAGGVAAADHDDGGAVADPRLEVRGGVIDARALEALQILDRQPPVACARGDDHRARRGSRCRR